MNKREKYKILFDKFLPAEEVKLWKGPQWGKETKIVKLLLETYPFEFLSQYNLGFEIKSLLWFLGKGKEDLRRDYNKFLLTKTEAPIKLEDKPIVEIEQPTKKISKMAEFLDL